MKCVNNTEPNQVQSVCTSFLLNVEGKLSSIASLGCVLVRTAVVEERRLWLQREDKTKVNVGNVHRWGQKSHQVK